MLSNHCSAQKSNASDRGKVSNDDTVFPSHEDQLTNLSRVEGQIRGIARMIEERRYCLDILNQLRSVHAALGGIEKRIFRRFLQICVKNAFLNSKNGDIDLLLDQIVQLLDRK